MNEFLKNLQRQASENPMVAIGIGAAFLQSASKFIAANSAREAAKTNKKEVERRIKKDNRSK